MRDEYTKENIFESIHSFLFFTWTHIHLLYLAQRLTDLECSLTVDFNMVKIKPYKNQDYQLLQEQHSSTRLFTDPEFLACIKSISHSGKLVVGEDAENSILNLLEWRRPYVSFSFFK